MLSRTADHLFWMSRYMERAENTARMLDVNYQTSLLPQSADMAEQGWRGLLSISELTGTFEERYREVNARNVMDFMVRDEGNLSSIWNCLRAARENARAVRGTLTTEVWETQNQTWLEFNRLLKDGAFERDPGAFFEWVKFRSHLSRGVTVGTMLMDEALHFIRIGTFLERADNTARLLDVKYHALTGLAGGEFFGPGQTPAQSQTQAQVQAQVQAQMQVQVQTQTTAGSALPSPGSAQEVDFYHWSAILRSVSGFEVYRKVYRNVIRPERVAELLILRPDMPRSLAACMNEVVANLQLVANQQSAETLRRAGRLKSDLQYGRIDEILATGLHAYLTQFLDRVNDLGVGISRDFLVPMAA
ncbi:MAG: alpha-E domain-containing protein [Betaproteobacteria bacterium]